jgi:hypothetical protein
VKDLAWQIPLMVLSFLFIARLCLAPFWMYRELEQRNKRIASRRKRRLKKLFNNYRTTISELRHDLEERTSQLRSKANRKNIEEKLALLYQEGYEHFLALNKHPSDIPVGTINDWENRTATLLGENLGETYKLEFLTCSDGLPSPYEGLGKTIYPERRRYYGYLKNRLELLKGYMKGLGDESSTIPSRQSTSYIQGSLN